MESFALRRARIRMRRAEAVLDELHSEYVRRQQAAAGSFAPEEIEQACFRAVQAECDRDLAVLDVEEASGPTPDAMARQAAFVRE